MDIEDCDLQKFYKYETGGDLKGKGDREDQAKSGREENEDQNAANDLRLTIRTLWKTGLEVFIHQLLYRRRIYPRDTFSSTRFVGVECKINNNPGVLRYIADALREVIPLLFGNDGEGCRLKEILIEIYDQATEITHEQYSLSFSSSSRGGGSIEEDVMNTGFGSPFDNNSFPLSDSVIGEVERDLRNLVCSTGKLDKPQSLAWDDSISFKIVIGFHQKINGDSTTPLPRDFDGNKWTEITSASISRERNRVLFNLANFACQLQYRLISTRNEQTEYSY